MGSHTAAVRDFQWTTYEKPRAPPSLPSLPPWAAHTQAQAPPVSHTLPPQPSADVGSSWRRPTSYFGAMKRLPMQGMAPDPIENADADDEEQRRHHIHLPTPSVVAAHRHQHPSQEEANERAAGRRERFYGDVAEPHVVSMKPTTNQREDDEPAEAASPPHCVPQKSDLPEGNIASAQDHACDPQVQPLATHDAYFRPWKQSNNNHHHNNDSDGGDDGEAATANKWKVRALLNPFAKRKASTKPAPKVYAPEPHEEEDGGHTVGGGGPESSENQAATTPVARLGGALPRTPPPRRPSVPTKRAESAPHECVLVSAPQRPRTPGLAPAPVAMAPEPALPLGSASRPRGRVPRFEDNADLPPALALATDLRKSTPQLAPLDSMEVPHVASRGEPPITRNHRKNQEEDDDNDDVARVLKSVPPKPTTQLQQLKQLHRQQTQKPKKGATLDALNAIKRKREERRTAQAEEKQRMKTELEQHGDDAGYKFRRLIQRYRDALPASQRAGTHPSSGSVAETAMTPSSQRLCVFVRKRPLAKKELKAKGYDILTCLFAAQETRTSRSFRRELVCHEPKLKVDCSEALENHEFRFDGVFDDDQSNEAVYTATVGPLVPSLVATPSSSAVATATAASAASLTVFAYGQTGSGKTYTMKSIYRQAAGDLFARLAASALHVAVGVSFYEIYMNQVNDLLNLRKRVQLMEDGEGVVQLLGLKEIGIASADELMELIQIGEDARATSANAVHDDSSRSHALLRVTITSAATGAVLARLSMVDLAGSERACDTQSDAKSTRMEGAEINKSLLALKECIRALDRGATHIPFRQSKLTQLLRDSFLCANSKTVMIATVSPCSVSCNHTLNTLRYADRLKEIGAS